MQWMENVQQDGLQFSVLLKVDATLAIIAEAHPAFSGAAQHTNNTVELTGIVKSFCLVASQGLTQRNEHVCINYDAQFAAHVCLDACQPHCNM